PVGELAADRDRRLCLVGNSVVRVVEAQSVPGGGGLLVPVVAAPNADPRALCDSRGGAGDRAVVGEHADLAVAELVGHRPYAQVVGVAVGEGHDLAGAAGRGRAGGGGGG